MIKKKYSAGFVAGMVLSAGFFIVTFFTFIVSPGQLLLQMDGDAVKNYFTFLYHVVNEKGAWFGGMNYPYGENVVFTDGQPFLSIPLSYLNSIFPFSYSGGLAILHYVLLVSYALAIAYLFKIFRHFQVLPGIAIVFATLIVFLSPQLLKINGHFALSYSCVIPMMWYWFIRYSETHQLKYPAFITLLGVVAVFSHPYFLAMTLFWLAFYFPGYLLFIKNPLKRKIRHLVPLACSFLLIFGVFKLFLLLTDPVKDRPTYPWGFLDACTTFTQIGTSTHSPIWQLFKDKPFYQDLNKGGEGNAYLGFVVMLTVLVALLVALKNLLTKKKDLVISGSRFCFLWLFVGIGTLIVGFCFPFTLKHDLIMHASVLRQFRSLGRFSLVFYYVMSVYAGLAIYACYTWLMDKNKKIPAFLLLGSAVCIWALECAGYAAFISKKAEEGLHNYDTFFSTKEKSWQKFLAEKGYKPEDFQAILLLPYFHVGTEKLWIGDNASTDWQLTFGLKAATQLKLPVVDVMMSRSSWGQAMKQVRLMGGPFTDKPILQTGNEKPFLLLYPPAKAILKPDSKYLLEASDLIGEEFNFQVYACYPGRIRKADAMNKAIAENVYKGMAPGDTCVNCGSNYFFVEHFKVGNTGDSLFGPGALKAKKDFDSTFLVRELPQKTTEELEYEFSAWALVNDVDYSSPNFELTFLDEGGAELGKHTIHCTRSMDFYNMWFRASDYFMLPAGCKKVSCKVYDWGFYSLDEVALRPAKALILSKSSNGSVMANNHFLRH